MQPLLPLGPARRVARVRNSYAIYLPFKTKCNLFELYWLGWYVGHIQELSKLHLEIEVHCIAFISSSSNQSTGTQCQCFASNTQRWMQISMPNQRPNHIKGTIYFSVPGFQFNWLILEKFKPFRFQFKCGWLIDQSKKPGEHFLEEKKVLNYWNTKYWM